MCFDHDALPPHVPHDIPGLHLMANPDAEIASRQRITLTSADGTSFAAYLARPAHPTGAGIVILPDVRGLFAFYEELAARFASVGVEALTIDYFGRTSPIEGRGADFDFMAQVMQTKPEQISQDVQAGIDRLRQEAGPDLKAVFTVGFCFGGGNSLQQAANHHGLAGVIAFYGPPTASRFGNPAPIDRISEFECPVLGLYGGADQGIPTAEVERFDQALTTAGLDHTIIIYPNAPHSFFDRTADQYQQESADAWKQMLAFIAANTPKATI
jgi:carboxymethylenebutenolidase